MESLENELRRFPRWKHDDIVDSLQMVYSLYELQPNSTTNTNFTMSRDSNWRPILSK
jgi:phage terminase large subunit-like protein